MRLEKLKNDEDGKVGNFGRLRISELVERFIYSYTKIHSPNIPWIFSMFLNNKLGCSKAFRYKCSLFFLYLFFLRNQVHDLYETMSQSKIEDVVNFLIVFRPQILLCYSFIKWRLYFFINEHIVPSLTYVDGWTYNLIWYVA